MTNYEGIEVGKMYDEYTEMEKSILPELPKTELNSSGNTPYMWNGHFWEYVMID